MNNGSDGQFHDQGFGASEDDKVAHRSSADFPDSIANGQIVNHSDNCVNETGLDGLRLGTEMTRGCVNTNDTQLEHIQLETVNIRDDSVREGQVRSVHNRDGVENQYAEDDADFG